MLLAAILALSLAPNPCGSHPHCVILTWSWTAPTADSYVFRMYRSDQGGPWYKVASGMTKDKWKDTNVISGLSYAYAVTAYDKTTKQETAPSNVEDAVIP